jgi:hypothetical protein
MEYLRLGLKTIPEVFPKQSYNYSDGIGNGIKTPMIETSFSKERNGLVTPHNEWIGAGLDENAMRAAQWSALASVVRVPYAELDDLILGEEILVHEDGPATDGTSPGRTSGSMGARKGKWQPALNGSMEKLLEGCAAFRAVREKCDKGEQPGHQEGMAMFHAAMSTLDGIDYFKAGKVPGWAKTDSDMKQLQHSLEKNYAPWTCRKMQENGVCAAGTQCFKPKPQVDIVEGQEVVRNDLPMLEPSPMRYAYGKGEDFLKKLQKEVDQLEAETDSDKRVKALKEIALRGQVFDKGQQKVLKEHIKKKKFLKVTELSKIFSEAAREAVDNIKDRADEREDTVCVDGTHYQRVKPYGYALEELPCRRNFKLRHRGRRNP